MLRTVWCAMLVLGITFTADGCGRTKAVGQTQPASTRPAALAKELILNLGNGVNMKLVLIPAGKFMMGSLETEKGRMWGEDQHEVTISNPFYMGMYPVTADQYGQFVKDTSHVHQKPGFPQTGDHPVVNVSWDDSQAFCKWLSKKIGETVTLPTDEQWEYACRAGSTTTFYFGEDENELGDYAWFAGNSGNTTHAVGQKKPNAWGLYDMHGNVWQWCSDVYAVYNKGPNDIDGTGLRVRDFHVVRGGSYFNNPTACRSACRDREVHDTRTAVNGFRIVMLPR